MFLTHRFSPLLEIPEVDRLFSELFSGVGGAVHVYPPVNVWRKEDTVYLTAELPGYGPGDVEVSLTGDVLLLKGKRPSEKDSGHSEQPNKSFERRLSLPFKANASAIEAKLRDGVLSVKLPRVASQKPRKISVK